MFWHIKVREMSLHEQIGRPVLVQLLRHFYADVRQHRLIGPVLTSHIEDWPAHIEKIADFWTQALGGPPRYAGVMPMKHIPLDLREEHFQAWLGLWEHNCKARLRAEVARELILRAHGIARRLREFCGVPA